MLHSDSLTANLKRQQQRALVSRDPTMLCCCVIYATWQSTCTFGVFVTDVSAACRSNNEREQQPADLPTQKPGVTTSTGPQVAASFYLSICGTRGLSALINAYIMFTMFFQQICGM